MMNNRKDVIAKEQRDCYKGGLIDS